MVRNYPGGIDIQIANRLFRTGENVIQGSTSIVSRFGNVLRTVETSKQVE